MHEYLRLLQGRFCEEFKDLIEHQSEPRVQIDPQMCHYQPVAEEVHFLSQQLMVIV